MIEFSTHVPDHHRTTVRVAKHYVFAGKFGARNDRGRENPVLGIELFQFLDPLVDNERIAVARVGVLYEFEFDKFTLSPQLHWDYHDGHDNAVVAGLAFGFAF